MLQYPVYKLINTVPTCLESKSLATVLDIFTSRQCDRLVIVNQTQQPIGLLYAARLLPKLLLTANNQEFNNLQLPLSSLDQSLITPAQIIGMTDNLENLKLSLKHLETETKNHLDWTIVDSEGKFLGLLDISFLLQLLMSEKIPISQLPKKLDSQLINQPINTTIIHFLDQLPWPLMLQNSTGQVISQNPAWWHQLGLSKDPEGLKQEIESILAPVYPQNSNFISDILVNDEILKSKKYSSYLASSPLLQEPPSNIKNSSSRCSFDKQQGICTCIIEIENSSEQIWQFAKVPLNSINWKAENSELEITEENQNRHENLWLILATDVTEQQQLCQELAAKNADLIQLNRLKDEFLACISHELKTPLTAVLGLSRLLVDQQLGQLNERQARYAELIHQSGRHLMSVVNDILDLTRMETGQMELTLTPVNIPMVCERALSEVKNIHNQTNKSKQISKSESKENQNSKNSPHQKFTLVIESELEQMVADELRLRQMLVHLLSNAFKFTEVAGEIGLKVSRWEGWIAFTVWDTGIGIPEHQQHLIFQKFQQLENPLTRQFEGTGLGLVLTRALARLHGGDVSFLSREGKGSQFTLLLPPYPSQTTINESNQSEEIFLNPDHLESFPKNQNQTIFSSRLVLIVEAVARYIEELSEHLKTLGYRVIIARSGTEALEKARRLQPQFIFLNPLLPLLSGWDVLTLLKSDSLTRHIHVIVTATGAEKEQAVTKQADGFLSLPIKYEIISSLLKQLTASQQTRESENQDIFSKNIPLRILRLVNSELDTIELYPSLREHRVIEVDDLEQADLLARVWQFDVVLLDMTIKIAKGYLERFTKYPKLMSIPLVTCDIATTLMASQIPGLCVFPCLSLVNQGQTENQQSKYKQDTLSSVLQIAAGICNPVNILVVDLNMLDNLTKKSRSNNLETERGSHWFQALIQYLKTAGFQSNIAVSWSEVLQQVSHQTVDLLLIYLGENDINKEMKKSIEKLVNLPFNLPPILIIDQQLNSVDYDQVKKSQINKNQSLESLLNVLKKRTGSITTQVLPRSISMEELLIKINQSVGINQDSR